MLTLWLLFLILKAIRMEPFIPTVLPTIGEVWPKPQIQSKSSEYFTFTPGRFNFMTIGHDCSLLRLASERYRKIIAINFRKRGPINEVVQLDNNFVGNFNILFINLTRPCIDDERPTLNLKEKYILRINASRWPNGILTSKSIWGILKGLETFSQLIYFGKQGLPLINATEIRDWPRFHHRGLLIDTARHYLPVSLILKNLDAMVYNKLNVLHWHIVDDESFPYQSVAIPELSKRGAYAPSLIYNSSDVAEIIEYARQRGIRVLVEIDTPGHTNSWGFSFPELLTACCDENGIPNGTYELLDPTREFTYTFVQRLLKEVTLTFPDEYIHLGGDNVEFDCWKTNPNINKFMAQLHIKNDYEALESYYIQKLINSVDDLGKKYIVWEEVFTNNVTLPRNKSIVQVWINDGHSVMQQATAAGYNVLLSAGYYLDNISSYGDWQKFYNTDPYDFSNSTALHKMVIGAEVSMWGESVNEYNFFPRVWPRASAAAEKFWSAFKADSLENAARRLEEHTCRMNKRGIPAQPPNGAGFCLV